MTRRMEKYHQENKNNSNIRRRKQDEPKSVERVRKFGATSKADPFKGPLRYLCKNHWRDQAKESWQKHSSHIIFYKLSLECKVLKNEGNKMLLMVRESGYLPVTWSKPGLEPRRELRVIWRASALITVFIHVTAKDDWGRPGNSYHIQGGYYKAKVNNLLFVSLTSNMRTKSFKLQKERLKLAKLFY